MQLNEWLLPLKAFGEDAWRRRRRGERQRTDRRELVSRTSGRDVMGHNMFGGARRRGARIRGWGLGRRPSLPPPVFILTHHAREPVEMDGVTTFHFVTETCGHSGRLLRRHDEQA
jgi:hypothetical protein